MPWCYGSIMWFHLILTTPWGRKDQYSYFTEGEREAHRKEVTCYMESENSGSSLTLLFSVLGLGQTMFLICTMHGNIPPLCLYFLFCFVFILKLDDDYKDASQKPQKYWINIKQLTFGSRRTLPPTIALQWDVNGFIERRFVGKRMLKMKTTIDSSIHHLNVVFTVCKLIGCSFS